VRQPTTSILHESGLSPVRVPFVLKYSYCSIVALDGEKDGRPEPYHKSRWEFGGWTFQERAMSRRMLIFSPTSLEFMCLLPDHPLVPKKYSILSFMVRKLVSGNIAEFSSVLSKDDPRPIKFVAGVRVGRGGWQGPVLSAGVQDYYEEWAKSVVRPYSQRLFTYPSDSLPALHGISTKFSSCMGDQPVLGMWEGNLARELLWTSG
jgi:hypothetical protein